jgi:hypothetical protein
MSKNRPSFLLRVFGLVLLGWTVTSASGCNTPTLPIPPPIIEALAAPDADGFVTIAVDADQVRDLPSVAYLMVFNTATQHGVLDARLVSGGFEVRIEASAGDALHAYWLSNGFEAGLPSRDLIVPAP